MLMMATHDEQPQLRPLSSAMTPEVFAELSRKALAISATLDGRNAMRNAEVYPGVTPHWHVVTVLPGQERKAADDLGDRCFGVYLPESEHTEVRRGRKVDLKRLMLPGYVLVFVWDVDRHMDRLRACDGVRGLLMFGGKAAIVPDRLVDRVREAENRERPLKLRVEVIKGRRRHSRTVIQERDLTDDDIVGVHSYSSMIEALRAENEVDRLSAFHKAMMLAPCTATPNQPTG